MVHLAQACPYRLTTLRICKIAELGAISCGGRQPEKEKEKMKKKYNLYIVY
jgi:hypothetical protein